MKENRQQIYTGERAQFFANGKRYTDCIFEDGESPLKHASNIELQGSMFRWKYPLWYTSNVTARDCTWFDMARAGVWYAKNIALERALIEAPKNFRRCEGLCLEDVSFSDAAETLWNCRDVRLSNVTASRADYFAMNCENMTVDNLTLYGNYTFDGAKNVTIRNSKLLSKDAFWNSENITVYDSFISGEYLGWNSKNLTLINCTVESLQGMCYIENLVMKNCRILNTTLAFEYSTVKAQIDSRVDSVLNPAGGIIRAQSIGELILEKDRIDPEKTVILCKGEMQA